jgi:alpha-tubulin suppressor-like RCC1 family protein
MLAYMRLYYYVLNKILLAGGQVFGWGWNEHGNLGLGDERDRHSPQLIDSIVRGSAVGVCIGGCHSFALVT